MNGLFRTTRLEYLPNTATTHSRELARHDEYNKLANAEHLYVDSVGAPVVGYMSIASVEQNWLRELTGDLLWRWVRRDSTLHDLPERVLRLARVVSLHEVEGAWPVRGTTREAVAHCRRASLCGSAIGQSKLVVRHVQVRVDVAYSASDRCKRRAHESLRAVDLELCDDAVGLEVGDAEAWSTAESV